MIIKNTGTKIVHIGTTMLMPEDTMTADKAVCEAPAIKAFVKKGLLSVSEEPKAPKNGNDAKAKAEAEAKAKAEAEAKAKAEAEAKAKAEKEAAEAKAKAEAEAKAAAAAAAAAQK